MQQSVEWIEGALFSDERGTISFVNGFGFPDVKRFYTIHHPESTVIRAWQGHKVEHKYFFVTQGKFLIAYVRIDNWEHPDVNLIAETKILSADKPSILSVPPGFANGIKALENNSTLISFSNLSIEEGKLDNARFDSSLWLDWSEY